MWSSCRNSPVGFHGSVSTTRCDGCSKVDEAAGLSAYLAGTQLSLADIAAVVNVHRFYMLKLDVAQYDHVRRWYETIASRPTFQKAIMSPEYVPMSG